MADVPGVTVVPAMVVAIAQAQAAGVKPPVQWPLHDAARALQFVRSKARELGHIDLVIIDEFGFDRIERGECPQAANLFYKVIDARSGKRSTALATNIDFEAWSDYLGDPPLAMAFLDRVVDGAILLKIRGKSYRAHRAKKTPSPPKPDNP